MAPEAHPSEPRIARVPRAIADGLIRESGSWLDAPEPAEIARHVAAWDAETRRAAPRIIAAHGVAPFLVRDARAAGVVDVLPDELRAWLLEQDLANTARIDRLLSELAAALRGLASAGVAVMPLKGALLATRPGTDPHRRPMADVDLLVRPGDRDAARATLTELGYRRRLEPTRRPTHDTFELPGNARVVSMTGEHPDNPRRIELHVEVKRHLWGWVDDDDLTSYLWAGARPATVEGEPAMVPTDVALLAHLAIHATSDQLVARGRLLQLVDIVDLAGGVLASPAQAGLAEIPHPRLAFPALALASRRLRASTPNRAGTPAGHGSPDALSAEVRRLATRVPPRLARWASEVPIDTRAGLSSGRLLPSDVATLEARWSRWAPYPWRLLVAHGDVPTVVAGARHAARVLSLARRRAV